MTSKAFLTSQNFDRWLIDSMSEYCDVHDNELPCHERAKQSQIRQRDAQLKREHAKLPIRRPKVLEVK